MNESLARLGLAPFFTGQLSPGELETQLIAANVDTLFIVTSCNEEFSESRLERYLALAYEAGVDPVVVLIKADLADDARGRHTTTSRSLHVLPNGGILLDVPGMRELKVADAAEAFDEVFADIESLATNCRFRDCRHEREPGCHVREAVETGVLDRRRLDNYHKPLREEAHYSTGLAEQRRQARRFGKVIRQHLDLKRQVGRKHPADG